MTIFKNKILLITGGTGSFGNAVLKRLLDSDLLEIRILSRDEKKQDDLRKKYKNKKLKFYIGDVRDYNSVLNAVRGVNYIFHAAALKQVPSCEFHPVEAVKTNILGTYNLLEICREYQSNFDIKFIHISTDEVFGSLRNGDDGFSEDTSYKPNSPYSATKAASDHLVRAWHHTYNLKTLITNCSNNYGPFQFPEKLIPLMISRALSNKSLPIYGDGKNIRDWLYVDDHAKALLLVALSGSPGETYNIGGHNSLQNIDVIKTICQILDKVQPSKIEGITKYENLITFVDDRPGHDLKYAIDASKIFKTLGWSPDENFNTGILKTVKWYLNNKEWWEKLQDDRNIGMVE